MRYFNLAVPCCMVLPLSQSIVWISNQAWKRLQIWRIWRALIGENIWKRKDRGFLCSKTFIRACVNLFPGQQFNTKAKVRDDQKQRRERTVIEGRYSIRIGNEFEFQRPISVEDWRTACMWEGGGYQTEFQMESPKLCHASVGAVWGPKRYKLSYICDFYIGLLGFRGDTIRRMPISGSRRRVT